jgi:hypothetical protein
MSIFDSIGQASATGGGNYLRPGKYVLRLKRADLKQGFKGESFVTEWLVKSAEALANENDESPNTVGSTVSMVSNFKNRMAVGNVKAMILGMLGEKESQTKPEDVAQTAQQMVSAQQPLRGMDVRVETYQKRAKESNKLLTLPNWYYIDEQDLKAQRKELDEFENRG